MHPRPDVSRAGLLFGGLALALVLSGCPQGADLENPDAWAGRFGTAGTGMGTGGSSMNGPVLDWASVSCDASLDVSSTTAPAAADFMTKTCAKQFCHGQNFVADLDLRPDDGFVKRTKDVFATFDSIPCADDVTMNCVPDTCPMGTKLIDSSNPSGGWIMGKTHGMQNDCGDPMPTGGLKPLEDACLTAIVAAVAALK